MKDRKIAKLLQECEDWMAETGGTAKQAASRYPEQALELEEILGTIHNLQISKKPSPSETFKAAAPARMDNLIKAREADKGKSAVTKTRSARHRRQQTKLTRRLQPMTWAIIIGLLAAAITGGGATVYASADALPGDALYPVKELVQDVELAFSDDAGDVELLLENLDGNVEDLKELAFQGRSEDILTGLEEYEETLGELIRKRTRVSYEDAGTEESVNQRIQSQLEKHSETLEALQLQTREQVKLQEKLQQALQLTETGKVYGPNEGGQNENPGEPNGAGPGEPQGEQIGSGKPEDAGQGNGEGKPEDAGSGGDSGNAGSESPGQGQGGKPDDAGNGDSECECTCIEPDVYCVDGIVVDVDGNLIIDGICTCEETGLLCGETSSIGGSGNGHGGGTGGSGGGNP